MSAPRLPAPAPAITLDSAEFWAATTEGRLLLCRCTACHQQVWYPRPFCPSCGGSTASEEAAGTGSVYSYTVIRRGEGPYAEAGPYVLAYVELDEGPRVLTNLVEVDPEAVRVGARVQAVFHDTGEGSALVRFAPAS